MANQGYKQRTVRLSDDEFEKIMHIVKANNCTYLSDFLRAIITQDLIVLKNFSKTP
jgi:hypothetical protein